jgi:hypothetical protein
MEKVTRYFSFKNNNISPCSIWQFQLDVDEFFFGRTQSVAASAAVDVGDSEYHPW